MDETGLLKLKKQIDDAKAETAELKGHLTALHNQLKSDWKCSTVEEAEKLVKKMDKDLAALNKQIETGLEELEEKYNG